jgi:hypothetical protein
MISMMTNRYTIILATAVAFSSCSSEPKNETPEQKEEHLLDEAAACDPLVGEFRELMAEYEQTLGEMVANKQVDAAKQEALAEKANDLSARIEERGENALGLKCWSEFQKIGRTYGPRIMKLGIEVAMMEGGMEGVDPAMLDQLQKVMH